MVPSIVSFGVTTGAISPSVRFKNLKEPVSLESGGAFELAKSWFVGKSDKC